MPTSATRFRPRKLCSARSEVPLEHFRELVRAQGMEAFRREWRRHALIQLRTTNQQAHTLLDGMLARYPGGDLMDAPAEAAAIPSPAAPESLRMPALVLYGDHENRSRAAAARALAAQLPHGELVVIADAGHMPNLDNPQRYNEIVRAFLTRHADCA